MIRPILPYPGSKWRFRAPILARLARHKDWVQFREPFVGSGAISIAMLVSQPRPTWVNDVDVGIYCLWKSLRDHPDLLRRRVRDFVPSLEAFDQLKAYLRSTPIGACDHDIVHAGFCKLALHCLSFSAIGLSGPKGGHGGRHIGKKWAPQHLSDNIARLQHYVDHIKITTTDYSELIADASVPCLLYLDPPYWVAGPQLYRHCFAQAQDHVELAQRLQHAPHPWVLSYDDCPQIRRLYKGWADIGSVPVKYARSASVTKTELLISSKLPTRTGG
jgi:DNA adenine methylase